METPMSTRRVTRSQTLAAANSNNIPMSRKSDEFEKSVKKSRQINGKQDRSALIDITNDSPIVGLAMGSLETPLSTLSKKRNNSRARQTTPGSGEALLRDQVKNLLQKVEEEAELSKLSLEYRPFLHVQGLVNSPIALLAPTPANTPQILNLSATASGNSNGLTSVSPSPVEDKFLISQIPQMVTEIFDGKKEEDLESEKNLMITRSLLLDFSEKSDGSDSSECSSVLTYQGVFGEGLSEGKGKSITDDDDSSIWSIQVNASTRDEEEEEEEEEEDDDDHNDGSLEEVENNYGTDDGDDCEEGAQEYDDGGLVDELCEGMRNINVNEERTVAKFSGKHTRFVYNSDDDIVGEEECGTESGSPPSPPSPSATASPSILRLKGLPTPKGKHLRFPESWEQ